MAPRSIYIFVILILQVIFTFSLTLDINRNDELFSNKIKLTIFYESYCPFSIRFILQQLYPVTLKYSNYINLDLIPFGNCKVYKETNGTVDFKCQHGEKECYGNRVHACVIEQGKSKGDVKTIEVIACLMNNQYADNEIETCLRKTKFSISQYKQCMKEDATDLEVYYGKRTAENIPKVNYVPFFMINGVYNKNMEVIATNNLEYAICEILGDEKPYSCLNSNLVY